MNRAAPGSPSPSRVRPLLFWSLLLGTTLALRLGFAWRFPGYLTGDDLEIVETAAKYAAGLDYQPWNQRCLFHPLVLVWPVMKLGTLAGAASPEALNFLATLPTAIFSTAAIPLVFLLSLRSGLSDGTARAAAFFYAFGPLALPFGATPYPRPISTALLLCAFLLASRPRTAVSALGLSGLAMGAVFAVRFSEAIALLPLLGWTWWRHRQVRALLAVLGGFLAGIALFAGLTDWLTWGEPLESFRQFLLLHRSFVRHPDPEPDRVTWYFETVLRWAGPILLLLLLPAWRDRRARPPLAILLSLVLLQSLSPYKYVRYLQGAVPFLAIAAAVGWEDLRSRGREALAAAALVLAVPYGIERSLTLLRDKSQSAIAAARFITTLRPPPRVVALEQQWAYGERLYLGNGPRIRDIQPERPLRPEILRGAAAQADVLAVYTRDLSPAALREIARLGFREEKRFRRDTSLESTVFIKRASERPLTPARAGGATPPHRCSIGSSPPALTRSRRKGSAKAGEPGPRPALLFPSVADECGLRRRPSPPVAGCGAPRRKRAGRSSTPG